MSDFTSPAVNSPIDSHLAPSALCIIVTAWMISQRGSSYMTNQRWEQRIEQSLVCMYYGDRDAKSSRDMVISC